MRVETATVSVLTMLMTVVPNAMEGGGAPTVMKTVSAAQLAVPLEEERSQPLLPWPSGCIRMAQATCKNDQVGHIQKTYSWGRATASGSEARATRGPNDAPIRILLVVTAQDSVVDEDELGRVKGRPAHTKIEMPSRCRSAECEKPDCSVLTKRRTMDDVGAVSAGEMKR